MAAFGKASTRKADGAAAQSSSDRIRACIMEKKPSLKTMWSQNVSENAIKQGEPDADAASQEIDQPKVVSRRETFSDDIDQEVLSQLPPSIQAEIRMSRGDKQKAGPSGKKDGMNVWLTKKASASTTSNGIPDKTSPTKKMPFAPSNPNDIDQDFLNELPADIRESVMKDIAAYSRSLQRQPSEVSKRKRGIDSFFAPSKK